MPGRNVQATLRPGQPGTKKLASQYGERLVCVRHCLDPDRSRRLITVELVVAEQPLEPRRPPAPERVRLVRVRIGLTDREMRQRVMAAGGRRLADKQCWLLPAAAARQLRLRPTGGEEE